MTRVRAEVYEESHITAAKAKTMVRESQPPPTHSAHTQPPLKYHAAKEHSVHGSASPDIFGLNTTAQQLDMLPLQTPFRHSCTSPPRRPRRRPHSKCPAAIIAYQHHIHHPCHIHRDKGIYCYHPPTTDTPGTLSATILAAPSSKETDSAQGEL
ncbi:hypothetical protein SprV_0401540800 [Sparganum proliferum]